MQPPLWLCGESTGGYRSLLENGRADLIGFGKECLIPPRPIKQKKEPDRPDGKKGRQERDKRTVNGGRDIKNNRSYGKDKKYKGRKVK